MFLSRGRRRDAGRIGRGDLGGQHAAVAVREAKPRFLDLAVAAFAAGLAALGDVYVNDAFFYHAWPEVWLGEWVAVDPTFGQYPADAAHLRFVIGGLAQQVEVSGAIGAFLVGLALTGKAEERAGRLIGGRGVSRGRTHDA